MNLPAKTRRRKRDEKIRRISGALRRSAGGKLDSRAFSPLLRVYAQAIVIAEALYDEIKEKVIVGGDKESIRPAVESFRRYAGEASRLASALGLTPVALRLVPHNGGDILGRLANQTAEVADGEIVPPADPLADGAPGDVLARLAADDPGNPT